MNELKKNRLNAIPTGIFTLTIIFLLQVSCTATPPRQIVGMSVSATNNQCYVWYDDYTVSMGSATDLNTHSYLYKYSLPGGKSAHDIMSIGIDSDGRVYTWYNDGTLSTGNTSNLSAYKAPYRYELPWGKSPIDIVSIGISSNDYVYTWYDDGTVSVGNPHDLDSYNAPYTYPLPQGKSANTLVGMSIPHNNDYIYAWQKTASSNTYRSPKSNPKTYSYGTNYAYFDATENLQFNVIPANSVNSIVSDFSPAFYKNQLMFSTFRRGNGNVDGDQSQVYFATRYGKKLSRSNPLRKGSRSAVFTEDAPTFTGNGRKVAYVRSKNFTVNDVLPHIGRSETKLDIYLADAKSQTNWENRKPFLHNSRRYSDSYPHLTAQGDKLYFASNRPGGHGGFDIYVSRKVGKTWLKPENLGPEINTEGDEISPFLVDNMLYFASDLHDGYGGYDVFKSIKINDEWIAPVNMGEDINSYRDEYDFIYNPDEKIAYFVSNRMSGPGEEDIYQATTEEYATPEQAKPEPYQAPQPIFVDNTPEKMVVVIRDEITKLPLEYVRIDLNDCYGGVYNTDANGMAILERFDSDCSIRISRSGYETNTHRFPMVKQLSVELSRTNIDPINNVVYATPPATPEQTVLIVRDKKTKLPIEGVEIDLAACNGKIYTTDAGGLTILDQFDNRCVIRIRKSGYEKNLYQSPTMAQLGVKVKQLDGGLTGIVMELEPDPQPVYYDAKPINVNNTSPTLPSNRTRTRTRSLGVPNSQPAQYNVTTTTSHINNDNSEAYEIQIGAFLSPRPGLSESFRRLGNVYTHQKNGMMVYKVGAFTKYSDAERVRTIVRNNGYPDAFINTISRPAPTYAAPPAAMQYRTYSTNSTVYKIQLGAFRNPNNARFNSQLEFFGDIQQTTRTDGVTVFFLGDFYNMSDATTAQQNAMNLGIKEAFIVKYRNGVKVK